MGERRNFRWKRAKRGSILGVLELERERIAAWGRVETIIMATCDRFSNKIRKGCSVRGDGFRQGPAEESDRTASGFLPHVHAAGQVETFRRGVDALVRRLSPRNVVDRVWAGDAVGGAG